MKMITQNINLTNIRPESVIEGSKTKLKRIEKIAGISGMASPILYIMNWIIGGIIVPEYSHVRDDVSSLMATGAPYKVLFDIINIISIVCSLIFYIGLFISFKTRKYPKLGPYLLIILGFVGLSIPIFFPLDEGGEITTIIGLIHFILVMVLLILTISSQIALWRGLKNVSSWKEFSMFCLISLILSIIFGFIGMISIGTEWMGLGERIAIFPAQLYYFIISLKLFSERKK